MLQSELTVPGMETVFTRAEMKEHSILDNLVISDLQIITEFSRSGPKFKPMILRDYTDPTKCALENDLAEHQFFSRVATSASQRATREKN